MITELWQQLGLALLAGVVVGAEREWRDKAAGLRTMTLISFGSALFTIMSIRIGGDTNAARIAAQIVSGVGFLGAGVIMRDGGRVTGLTTAATVWLTASLGMGFGAGYASIALAATGLTLGVLLLLPILEGAIDRRREVITYQISAETLDIVDRLDGNLATSGLRLLERHVSRSGQELTASWTVVGRHEAHARLERSLLADPTVTSVRT